jgi:electron transfer flavoprotein beta subunit
LKIAVCLKRVPDTTSKIVIGADRKSIDEAGLKFVPNPYDEFAIEEALALKEKAGAGETVVYALGTDASAETLRTAMAMGSDRAVLLKSPGSPDGLAVAQALAAELLGLPCISSVAHLKIEGGAVEAEREIEGGIEVSTCALPAVLTCDKGLNNPRLPSLKGIMAAKKKPLETKPATLGTAGFEVVGLELPPERQPGRIVGEGAEAVPELVSLLQSEAKVL